MPDKTIHAGLIAVGSPNRYPAIKGLSRIETELPGSRREIRRMNSDSEKLQATLSVLKSYSIHQLPDENAWTVITENACFPTARSDEMARVIPRRLDQRRRKSVTMA